MSRLIHEGPALQPGARAFQPAELATLTRAEAERRLRQTAPYTLKILVQLTATVLTDPRRCCDAALIVADQLREGAREISARGNFGENTLATSMAALADELTEAAPLLPGGALAERAP